jgi:hypothetical protein
LYGKKRHVYTILVGKTEGKKSLEGPRLGGRIRLKLILRECDGRTRNGLICLKIGTNDGLLWKWEDTFGDHKMGGIY